MASTHLEFLTEKMQTVSAQYTEAITSHQQRSTLMAETLHNLQAHNMVINPSSPEELLNNGVLSAVANRNAQGPILGAPTN